MTSGVVRNATLPGTDGEALSTCLACLGLKGNGKHIGNGAFGDVFRIPMPANKTKKTKTTQDSVVAVKLQDLTNQRPWLQTSSRLKEALEDWKAEADFATRAGELEVGPRVHDAFVCQRDGTPYGIIVMDLKEGPTLGQWRNDHSNVDTTKVDAMLVAKMATLHSHGIWHGDLHPWNVIVQTSKKKSKVDDVWIVDYGFAVDAARASKLDLRRSSDNDIKNKKEVLKVAQMLAPLITPSSLS